MYEKTTGIFCVGCEPTDTEEIRTYRQERADRKAERLEGWADKREQIAEAQLNSNPNMRHDIAFITQPGHIPVRARMIKADGRAFESLNIAKGMRDRAENIRNVRVKGDAECIRQEKRDAADKIIVKGSMVKDPFFGGGVVTRINKKTYTIKFESGGEYARDKSWIKLKRKKEA